jgi:hypothetical protein
MGIKMAKKPKIKINISDLEEGSQLRILPSIEKEYATCFRGGDIVTVGSISVGVPELDGLFIICRRRKLHSIEEFICNDAGDIDGLEKVMH